MSHSKTLVSQSHPQTLVADHQKTEQLWEFGFLLSVPGTWKRRIRWSLLIRCGKEALQWLSLFKLLQGSAERGADFERNDLRFFNEPSDRLMTRNRVWWTQNAPSFVYKEKLAWVSFTSKELTTLHLLSLFNSKVILQKRQIYFW